MTELPHHRDDEIVSAVLDGEATADERARVDTDPELQRRLAEMRQVRDAVAVAVDPLDEVSTRRLVDRALTTATDQQAVAGRGAVRGEKASRPRRREGALIGLGSAAAVVILALLVGPGLLSTGDDDSADVASMAGEFDDAGPEALSDGEAHDLEDFEAADSDWLEHAGPPYEAAEAERSASGGFGAGREWLGTHDSVDDLLVELGEVLGHRTTAAIPFSATWYGFVVPECPEPDGDAVSSDAFLGPFTVFEAVVDGRALVVIVGADDTGEPALVILDLATCELVDPS